MANPPENRGIKKAARFLETVRNTIGGVISVQLVHTFVMVAENEGRGVVEYADMAGLSKSTMSRQLLDLAETLRSGQDGYKLVQRVQDPSNLRSVNYLLTDKGKRLRNTINNLYED